jgi:hypothetical protein
MATALTAIGVACDRAAMLAFQQHGRRVPIVDFGGTYRRSCPPRERPTERHCSPSDNSYLRPFTRCCARHSQAGEQSCACTPVASVASATKRNERNDNRSPEDFGGSATVP